jgi:hypothetical protein
MSNMTDTGAGRGSLTTTHVWTDARERSWTTTLRWRLLPSGRCECVGFAISSDEETDIVTRSLLREVPLGWLVQKMRPGPPGVRDDPTAAEMPKVSRRTGRLGLRHYEQVARVYSRAFYAGDPPTKAVAETFDVPYSTAARWVRKCRFGEVRFLGLTEPGVPGGVAPFDENYARRVLAEAGHSESEIERVLMYFPRWIEPELVEATRAAKRREEGPEEGPEGGQAEAGLSESEIERLMYYARWIEPELVEATLAAKRREEVILRGDTGGTTGQ